MAGLRYLALEVSDKGLYLFSRDIPVSYTHLDVYKRQILSIWATCAGQALATARCTRAMTASRRIWHG